jgi:hypothetical protein
MVLDASPEAVAIHFALDALPNLSPRYNIAPYQLVWEGLERRSGRGSAARGR